MMTFPSSRTRNIGFFLSDFVDGSGSDATITSALLGTLSTIAQAEG